MHSRRRRMNEEAFWMSKGQSICGAFKTALHSLSHPCVTGDCKWITHWLSSIRIAPLFLDPAYEIRNVVCNLPRQLNYGCRGQAMGSSEREGKHRRDGVSARSCVSVRLSRCECHPLSTRGAPNVDLPMHP